ncbi:MAG: YtxH domain-containing protein [Bacteroidales bacterium]|nr:YtxH domain-containing protein [Bacteroidales bacterium]
MKPLTIFLGGLAVGAIAGLLLAPEKGEDLRDRIKSMLKKRGIIPPSDIDVIIAEINADLENSGFGTAHRPVEDGAE